MLVANDQIQLRVSMIFIAYHYYRITPFVRHRYSSFADPLLFEQVHLVYERSQLHLTTNGK